MLNCRKSQEQDQELIPSIVDELHVYMYVLDAAYLFYVPCSPSILFIYFFLLSPLSLCPFLDLFLSPISNPLCLSLPLDPPPHYPIVVLSIV